MSANASGGGRGGLQDEIALLRLAVRRLFALSQEQDDGEAVKTLTALSAAAARLARIVQTQAQLSGASDGDLEALLMQALSEVRQELGL